MDGNLHRVQDQCISQPTIRRNERSSLYISHLKRLLKYLSVWRRLFRCCHNLWLQSPCRLLWWIYHLVTVRRWCFVKICVQSETNSKQCKFLPHAWYNPANTTHWCNVGQMLGQRRRRWANIGPTLDWCDVFAGKCLSFKQFGIDETQTQSLIHHVSYKGL